MAKSKTKRIDKLQIEEPKKNSKQTQPSSLETSIPKRLSILPLRDIIIFPNMIFPILIGRPSSLKAVSEALERDKFIFVSAQKSPFLEDIDYKDLYKFGTVAKIIQIIRLPNNLLKVLIEGFFQAKIVKRIPNDSFIEAEVKIIIQNYEDKDPKLQALIRRASELFNEYVKNDKNLPPEIINAFDSIVNPQQKLYYGAANIRTKLEAKQKILEQIDIFKQYLELNTLLTSEIEMMKLENEIDSKVQNSIQQNQRKYYIQEQIRALQQELGDDEGSSVQPDIAKLRAMLDMAKMPEHAKNKAEEELERLKKIHTMSPEYSTNRNYIEMLATVPWSNFTKDNFDIANAHRILDEDHYDLEKPKERILEYIAVLNLSGHLKKQILCFVGPPGVGKTSLAKSIARALGRNFVRFSLGGVRDEAEIRGHRRTYIGSMPGRIIQSMKKAGSVNPVILLDEIDKMSMDFRGDPSAALLEVLDPEQNIAFNDHYLEVDYDLSNVMFITTANVRHAIPVPLQDRMEIIELSSYLENDKLNIAKQHIFPKLLEEFGMSDLNITITDNAILKVIREYTREAGVRNLFRELSSILRKLAKDIVIEFENKYPAGTEKDRSILQVPECKKAIKRKKYVISEQKVEEYLKLPKFKERKDRLEDKVGVVTGLAWTSVGGEILQIEATIMPGAEKLTLTGKLGDVMKESAAAALSFVRSNYNELKIPKEFNSKKEIHIHVPEGAIPKDGPSAGITIAIALISAATGNPVIGDLAMTGEINLRGEVLAIGGLKEKLLAAKRLGISKVLIPEDNAIDLDDISDEIKTGLNIIPVRNIFEALKHTFNKPKPNKTK